MSKLVISVVAAFAFAVTSGAALLKKPAASVGNETFNVANHTVSGNVTNDLNALRDGELKSGNKTITKFNVDKDRVIYIHSEVSYGSMKVAVDKLKALNKKSSEPILLDIDSPGGSVFDGATLISEMEASKAPVYTVCRRMCASMAAMIHSYGKQRYSLDRAILMYHPASGGANGQVPNMLSLLTAVNRYTGKMNANIVKRSNGKIDRNEFEKYVAYELWIDSEDSLDKGLIDSIIALDTPNEPTGESLAEQHEDSATTTPVKRGLNVQMISPYPELWSRK